MDIIAKLKDAYAFLGDPLHREAWEEIERLQKENDDLSAMVINLIGKEIDHVKVYKTAGDE